MCAEQQGIVNNALISLSLGYTTHRDKNLSFVLHSRTPSTLRRTKMNEVQRRLNGTSRKKTQATGKDLIKSRMRVGSRQDYRETVGEFLKPFE